MSPQDKAVRREIERIGRAMLALGYQNTHSGNISARVGDEVYITKTGSMKGHLGDRDICLPGLDEPRYGLFQASSETGEHRRVLHYAKAMVHAHPPETTLLSFTTDSIVPADPWGRRYLGRVPVLTFEYPVGSPEMEETIPEVLKGVPALVVATHGPFIRGESLEEAFFLLCLLEASSSILLHAKSINITLPDGIPLPNLSRFSPPLDLWETLDPELHGQYLRTSSDLFLLCLSPFRTASLSVIDGPCILIMERASAPEEFPHTLLRLPLNEESPSFPLSLHREVYRMSHSKAALFTLSPEVIFQSLRALDRGEDRIVPVDAEGGYFYPAIPVLPPDASEREIVKAAVKYKMAAVAGVGLLSVGYTLGHAIHHASSARSLCFYRRRLQEMEKLGTLDGYSRFLCARGKDW